MLINYRDSSNQEQTIFVPDSEMRWQFVQASGPGGQNVNKVATAVRLTFDIVHTLYLPDELRQRLLNKLSSSLTDGCISILVRSERSQYLNRREGLVKLEGILCAALRQAKKRKATKPTHASVIRRLTAKKRQANIKTTRKAPNPDHS